MPLSRKLPVYLYRSLRCYIVYYRYSSSVRCPKKQKSIDTISRENRKHGNHHHQHHHHHQSLIFCVVVSTVLCRNAPRIALHPLPFGNARVLTRCHDLVNLREREQMKLFTRTRRIRTFPSSIPTQQRNPNICPFRGCAVRFGPSSSSWSSQLRSSVRDFISAQSLTGRCVDKKLLGRRRPRCRSVVGPCVRCRVHLASCIQAYI